MFSYGQIRNLKQDILQSFSPVDNSFEPVKHNVIKSNCYFSNKKFLEYRTTYERGGSIKQTFECHYCSSHCMRKNRYKKRVKSFSSILGVLYNFNTQSLVSFEENLKYKDDLPFAGYCAFDGMTTSECSLDMKRNEMLPALYGIILVFHSDLNLYCIII